MSTVLLLVEVATKKVSTAYYVPEMFESIRENHTDPAFVLVEKPADAIPSGPFVTHMLEVDPVTHVITVLDALPSFIPVPAP